MGLGYDGKLYILAFDHRGSFTKRFGIEGDPTPEETERIADGKHLIFEGLQVALGRGADPSVTGALVDEQFDLYASGLLGCACGHQAGQTRELDPTRWRAARERYAD